MVVDAEVHVVTADTLVGCEATAEVQFGDGRTGIGHVIGRDPVLDVALLEVKVAGSPVAMASVGDVAALRVGSAIAVPVWDREGPPGLHLRQGKVLEVGRAAAPRFSGPYIGTDIPSELAEVGGPLLDAGGKVVGLIVSSGPPSGHGASAIPMDAVRGLLPQLARLGRVPRGWVGFVPQPCTPPLADALGGGYEGDPVVAHVVRGGPADRAGIRPGDVVVMFSGVRVRSVEALADAIAKAEVGSIVRVDTLRGGRLYPFSVHVAETPQSSGWPPRPDPLLQLSIHVLPVTPGLRSLWDPRLANGLLVTRVASAGAGEAAGLEPDDLLRAVNGHPLEGREAVGVANQALRTGGRILWLVERGGVTRLVVTATQSEGTRPRGPGDRSRREGRSNLAHGR